MKEAIVYKHRSGWWAIKCRETGRKIGGLCDTEAEAIREANAEGYIVV